MGYNDITLSAIFVWVILLGGYFIFSSSWRLSIWLITLSFRNKGNYIDKVSHCENVTKRVVFSLLEIKIGFRGILILEVFNLITGILLFSGNLNGIILSLYKLFL